MKKLISVAVGVLLGISLKTMGIVPISRVNLFMLVVVVATLIVALTKTQAEGTVFLSAVTAGFLAQILADIPANGVLAVAIIYMIAFFFVFIRKDKVSEEERNLISEEIEDRSSHNTPNEPRVAYNCEADHWDDNVTPQ